MTSQTFTTNGAGAPPELPPDLLEVSEGPMRRELLRQIAHLDHQISGFVRDNCPLEATPPATRRGPAVLSTSDLEAIRDELLAARAHLHERIVERVTERMALEDSAPQPGALTRLRNRLRG